MQKIVPAFILLGVISVAVWLSWGSINPAARPPLAAATSSFATTTTDEVKPPFECNADGKVCPDGSTVGRTGEQCEFASCPTAEATNAVIRTSMGQVMTGLNISITPHEVIDDSRCPADVQCIWAGTVYARVTIKTPNSVRGETLELGKSVKIDGYTITFTELTPVPTSGEVIPVSSYRFIFSVSK